MIKRILVALDTDVDTTAATQYAVDVGQRYNAAVHSVAVVDAGYHDTGGGVGSMYYQEKLHEEETAEGRTVARQLTDAFEQQVRDAGVRFGSLIQEGAPADLIIRDMQYFDLLVIGHDPHFVYSKPGRATQLLEKITHECITPALVVENEHRPVSRVLIAYDGSRASGKALHRFAQLLPFGTELDIDILNIYEQDEKESGRLLSQAQAYLESHGLKAKPVALSGGDPRRQIVEYASGIHADLVVVGSHSVSKLHKLAFGSTTSALLKNSPIPLFMDS